MDYGDPFVTMEGLGEDVLPGGGDIFAQRTALLDARKTARQQRREWREAVRAGKSPEEIAKERQEWVAARGSFREKRQAFAKARGRGRGLRRGRRVKRGRWGGRPVPPGLSAYEDRMAEQAMVEAFERQVNGLGFIPALIAAAGSIIPSLLGKKKKSSSAPAPAPAPYGAYGPAGAPGAAGPAGDKTMTYLLIGGGLLMALLILKPRA